MGGRRQKIVVEGGVVWNSIWSQGHEVAKALAHAYDVYYLEPVRTTAPHAHLQEKSAYAVPKNVTLVQHTKVLGDIGAEYWRYSEMDTLKILKEIKPDILLTYQCLLGLRAFNYAKKNNIKTVYMLVDEYAALSKSLVAKTYLAFAEPYFLRNSDGILCTAKALQERAQRYPAKNVYIPNGIHQENLRKMASGKARKHARVIVGFVGTLGQWVDASWFMTIANAYPNVDVLVIGGGEGYDWLMKQERPKNLQLLGFLPHHEAIKHMRDFDIALIPFKVNKITHAVSPIKLFEYWSMGKPVVAPKTKELEQFSDAIVFSDGDLVGQIGKLIASDKQRTSYGKRGKAIVPKYDWTVLGKHVREFVGSL